MSRVLITCWPFTGHLLPQMSIARALRERGHDVAFYSGPAVRTTIQEQGFEFFGFDRVAEDRAFAAMRAVDTGDRRSRPGGGRLAALMRDWLVETIPGQLEDLRAVLTQWRPDVLATDLSLWAPMLIMWESERIPVALSSTFMGPLIPGPDAPAFGFGMAPPRTSRARRTAALVTALTELAARPMRRRLDEIRRDNGLGPLGESVNRFTGRLPLYLVGSIRELDYGRRDLPSSVHYVGNCIWYPQQARSAELLERIPAQRPWVHVTESTLAYGEPFLLRAAIEALAGEDVELIVTTGEHRDGRALGPHAQAPNVHIAPFLSHGELMPRCSAVISVGGKATVLAAMDAGVPMVLVPTTWDKPDNARRVASIGAGVVIRPRRLTPVRLREAVLRLLNAPGYRAVARHMSDQLGAAPGPQRAAELLEALAASTPRARVTAGGPAR